MEVVTASLQEEVDICITNNEVNEDEEIGDREVEVKKETCQSPTVDMEVEQSCKTGEDDGEEEVKIEFPEEQDRTDDDEDTDPLVDYKHETILPHHDEDSDSVDADNDSQESATTTGTGQKQKDVQFPPGPFRSRMYYVRKENGRRLKMFNERRMLARQRLKDMEESGGNSVKKSDRKCVSPPPPPKHRSSKRIKLKGQQPFADAYQNRPANTKVKVAVPKKKLKKQPQPKEDELTLEIRKLKVCCPLQLLPNPENSMEHHCLICYKKLIEDETGQKTTGDDGLHDNLNILLVLRRLLQVPSEDVKKCLRYCGNPTNWFRVCMECQPLIQNALNVNDKLVEVLKQLDKCRELIVKQMRISRRNNNKAFQKTGKCPTCGITRCRGHEKYLTDKIRNFVSKKTYPGTTNPYEEGDREADAKARVASEVISNCFEDNAIKHSGNAEDISFSWSDHVDDALPEDVNTEDNHVAVEPLEPAVVPAHNGPPFLLIFTGSDMLAPIVTGPILSSSSSQNDLPLLLNLPSRDISTSVSIADPSPQTSTFTASTRTYHCSACPDLPTPDGMNFNQYLCHITFHIRRPFQCTECKLFFPMNETVREQHWKIWHTDTVVPSRERFQIVLLRPINLWGCQFCDENFSTEGDRDDHLKKTHELQHNFISRQYVCFHCPRMFYNKNDRRTHIVVDQCSNANIFNCPICEKGFKRTTAVQTEYLDEPALYQHIDETHPDQISMFKLKACELCGLVFVGVPNQFPGLVTHKRTTHGYATAFTCHICDDDFASGSLLKEHLSSMHYENPPPPIVSKTVKKARKSTFFPATQRQVKLQNVSKRPIEPTPVCLPSTSAVEYGSAQVQTNQRSRSASKKPAPAEPLLYSCAACPHLSPKRLYDFLKHIAFHEKRPNRCVECSVYLPNDETAIADHWSQFHNGSDKFPHCTEVSFNLENIWKCSKCPERFSSIEEQFRHERRAHRSHVAYGEGKYTCITCSQNLHSYVEWQLHRAVKHPQIAEISCFYCEKTFLLQTKEGIDLCDTTQRIKHVKEKHPKEKIKLMDPCRLCGVDFVTFNRFNHHLKSVHSIPDCKLYPCPIPHCTYATNLHSTLRGHICRIHIPSQEEYICDNCGWRGKCVRVFREHQFKIHGIVREGAKVLTCEFDGCSFQALRPFTIKAHALIHLPEKDRPFKCEVCGKGFYDKKHFSEHQEIHANKQSKPYQCEICGNSFAVKNYLYIHKRLSHQRRFFPSTHKKKPKRTTSKGLSKTKTKKHSEVSATSSDLVYPEKPHELLEELVATNGAPTTTTDVRLPDGSNSV
ncbi:unnamed protein product [Orchesella dallaii]|uniref:C2H2-type domain-containing protein n=1 Tax=Orchesella dallaii TaxID=48710 RepID=A0ABP1Q3G6_9HEXA